MSDELWKQSMEKLKTDKSKFNGEEVFNIFKFIDKYQKPIPQGIKNQIIKDIKIYKKYDCIAMWVGTGGLIDFEPEFIKGFVKIFGIEE